MSMLLFLVVVVFLFVCLFVCMCVCFVVPLFSIICFFLVLFLISKIVYNKCDCSCASMLHKRIDSLACYIIACSCSVGRGLRAEVYVMVECSYFAYTSR